VAIEWRLYDLEQVVTLLFGAGRRESREMLQGRLRQGVHPFFLQQLYLLVWKMQSMLLGTGETHQTEQGILEQQAKKMAQVPEPWADGLSRSASRIYERGWAPRRNLDEGILHGALMECARDFWQARSKGMSAAALGGEYISAFERFLDHPDADVRLLSNFYYLGTFLSGAFQQEKLPAIDVELTPLVREYLKQQIRNHGIQKATLDLLEIWSDSGSWIFWVLVYELLIGLEGMRSKQSLGATKFLTAVLDQAQAGKGQLRATAARVGALYPMMIKGQNEKNVRSVLITKTQLVDHLKQELPDMDTYHAIVRWLQTLPVDRREGIVLEMVFQGLAEQSWLIDSRAELLLEELLGPEAWQALCALQDERFWKKSGKGDGGIRSYRANPDRTSPEYRLFLSKLQEAQLGKHDWRLAEAADRLVADSRPKVTEKQAKKLWEETVDLLAGDIVLSVTHLQTQLLSLPRHCDEFLGDVLPVVKIAEHPQLKQNGAACIFSIDLPDLPDKPLTGSLDAEGEIVLDRVCVLTPTGRQALQAVVVQSVAALVIPHYLDTAPVHGEHGGGLAFTGEVYGRRPVIHKLGDLSQEREEEANIIPSGTRINPAVAWKLFQWLMDEDLLCPYRLHRQLVDKPEGREERLYPTWREAKELLKARKVELRGVHFRTIRAHTRPVAAQLTQSGTVVFQHMTDAAKRKYEFFVKDIGRELDLTAVRKTYLLPSSVRVVLDVPRTFNQGTFNTLEEVWQMVPDRALKARAKQSFKM